MHDHHRPPFARHCWAGVSQPTRPGRGSARVGQVTDPDEQDRHWQLARAGRKRGWWESYRDVLTDSLGSYIGFENDATSLKIWSWGVFPGLLQTEAYARALFASDPVRTEPKEADRLIAARMQRQQRITDDGLNLWVVLDESLLHRQVGPQTCSRSSLSGLPNHHQGRRCRYCHRTSDGIPA
nr:Scr1 family TA system antitoxin-like transcriptional regulator [Salinispora cortesiana]